MVGPEPRVLLTLPLIPMITRSQANIAAPLETARQPCLDPVAWLPQIKLQSALYMTSLTVAFCVVAVCSSEITTSYFVFRFQHVLTTLLWSLEQSSRGEGVNRFSWGQRIPVEARFSVHVQTGPGAHPASRAMGTGPFQGVKRPGRGADHQPSPSAEFENEKSYTSTPPLGSWWPVIGWTEGRENGDLWAVATVRGSTEFAKSESRILIILIRLLRVYR
jgi:hypothetical protein